MRSTIICIGLFVVVRFAAAQSEFSLYRLNGNLPQANLVNAAFYPNSKVVIGLPVISSVYASYDNAGIAFRDVFRNSETDSLAVDTVSLFNKLKDTNRIKFNESVQLFYFGLRGKKSYFSLGVHHVSETRLNYPGDLAGWAIRGPADPHYSGKPLDLANFYGRMVAYNKVSVNYARDLTSRFRVGVRFNYLLGVAAGETSKVGGTLTVNADSVNINTKQLLVQTAGFDFFDQDNLSAGDYTDYFLKTKNTGMAWDFGATYALTDNLTLSAAVNDLGYIKWKDYTHSYQVDPVNYTFKGFDILDYLNQGTNDEFLQAELDSLENLYKSTETKGTSFKTSLVGKIYAGVNFRVLRVNNFSALFYMDMFQKRINPAVSLGYNLQLGRLLNATVGITYQDGKINNVGAGIALKLLNIQVYGTSDRANSYFYPARAGRADGHVGVNLVFGKVKKAKWGNDDTTGEEEEKQEVKQDTIQPPVEEPLPPAPDTAQVQTVQAPAFREAQPDTTTVPVKEPEPVVKEEPKPQPVQPEITPPVVTAQPAPKTVEPPYEVVKKGTHPEELPVAHYVIAGTFRSKENAQRYSRMLRDQGYTNNLGFVTAKNVYYVYVHKSADLEDARRVRDNFRQNSNFQFQSSWVLTVEE